MCLTSADIAIPCNDIRIIASAVFVSFAFVAASRCIFPFGFGGQAEVLSRKSVELFDEFLAVIPAYLFHRTFIISCKVSRVAAHDGLP